MRIVYKGNYIRMMCGEIGLVEVLPEYIPNIKALDLVVSDKKGFKSFLI